MKVRVVLALLLAGAASARPEAESEAWRTADARLRAGMPLLAVRLAEACLEQDPTALACAEVLGRAAAYTGDCARGLAALADARRGGSRWGVRSALAEGVCRVRTEDLEGALGAFDEAARLDPDDQGPWLQRALVDLRLGRIDDVDRDAAALLDVGAEDWAFDLVALWRAWTVDDPALDGLIAAVSARGDVEVPTLRQHLGLVDCQRWLDLRDPFAAEAAARRGKEGSSGNARLQACLGEALRVGGDADLAERVVRRDRTGASATPVIDAVLVRALVDQGRLDEADAVLAALSDPDAPAAVASAWYLARARGDADAVARLAARAATLPAVPERTLDRLIPVAEAP